MIFEIQVSKNFKKFWIPKIIKLFWEFLIFKNIIPNHEKKFGLVSIFETFRAFHPFKLVTPYSYLFEVGAGIERLAVDQQEIW